MSNSRKKAFTLTEMIIVVTIIWILMMWMTVYIGWSLEKTKIIEAQWCAASLWWEINNYLYYTLTSKTLKINNTTTVSPNFYHIWLTWHSDCRGTSATQNGNFCNGIVFGYSNTNSNPIFYETHNVWNTCRQAQPKLWFYRSWGTATNHIKYLTMNKWFSPLNINEMRVFYLQWSQSQDSKETLWNIVIVLCSDDDCTTRKQVWKRDVDWRSQTISLKKCKFYDDTDPNKCKEREL